MYRSLSKLVTVIFYYSIILLHYVPMCKQQINVSTGWGFNFNLYTIGNINLQQWIVFHKLIIGFVYKNLIC